MKIPACLVSKSKAQELEKYLAEQVSLANKQQAKDGKYSFLIADSIGSETLTSVSDHDGEAFPNDTGTLRFSHENWKGVVRTLVLSLSTSDLRSTLEISTEGKGAKELALGIAGEVKRRLKENRSWSFVFHGFWFVIPFAGVGIGLGLGTTALLDGDRDLAQLARLFFVASGFLFPLWLLLNSTQPYCGIDTPRYRQVRAMTDWFLKGLLGLVVFGGVSRLIWH
jgi:hypothetical protein